MSSIQPRKQRYMLYNAPLHKKRKMISGHLAENLLLKYDRRSLPVIKGDTVKVMRGSYRGHEDKITKVNVRDQTVEIEGVTLTTAKGTKLAKPIHASTLMITKLNITDKWRRHKLEKGLSETQRKEIEKEAADQLKEKEAQKKAEEEARKADEKLKEEAEKEQPAEEPAPAEAEKEDQAPAPEEEPAQPVEETPKEKPAPAEQKKKPAAKKPAAKTPKKKKEGEEP